MKNKLPVLLLSLTLSGLMVTAASAHPGPPHGPHGPHGGHHGGFYGPGFFPSLSFVIATDDNDESRDVSMVGHVLRRTGDSSYLFSNGSDTFHIYSDDSDLPVGPTIVIGGRLDDGRVDLRKWHYAE